MAKLTTCKTCGAQIAKSAKACPNCGARQRNRHPVLTVILTLVLILFIIGLAVSIAEQKPTKVESTNAPGTRAAATASPAPTVFTVGDTAEMNKVRVTLVAVRSGIGADLFTPEAGNVFLTFELEIENGTDAEIAVSSLASFSAYADDYALSYSLSGILADGGKQLDGAIAAGKKMHGVVAFEAPADWQNAEIRFKPNVWSGREFVFQAANGG